MQKTGRWWRWALLAGVLLAALLLRMHDVSRIFLWLGETDTFNEYIFGEHPKSLLDFAVTTRSTTTLSWGWPAVVWVAAKLFGATIGVARMPTVLLSTVG